MGGPALGSSYGRLLLFGASYAEMLVFLFSVALWLKPLSVQTVGSHTHK